MQELRSCTREAGQGGGEWSGAMEENRAAQQRDWTHSSGVRIKRVCGLKMQAKNTELVQLMAKYKCLICDRSVGGRGESFLPFEM